MRDKLEDVLGPRAEWSVSLCRGLFDALMAREDRRARTPDHEVIFFRLLSWCARPGLGAAGDGARLAQLQKLTPKQSQRAVMAEWWILWRRVAPGLDADAQSALYDDITENAATNVEALRALSCLERLDPARKVEAKALIEARLSKIGNHWPIGRLGARAPLSGRPVPADVAEAWLEELLDLDWKKAQGADFAAALIARRTDSDDDVSEKLRKKVLARLAKENAPTPWTEMVTRASGLSAKDEKRVFGEALPAGLRVMS